MKLALSHRGSYLRAGTALLVLLVSTACGSQGSGAPAPQATTAAQPTTAPATRVPATTSQPAASAPAMAASSAAVSPTTAAPSGAATPAAQAAETCVPGSALTPAQTEGPYYKANPPQKSSLLEPGMAGMRLLISGRVQTADCRPLAGARVDFWQADDAGGYDNAGYRLRGYTLTDENGSYSMETIIPGLYPGRTRHIHVKVQPQGGQTLTTQLYFPDEPANSRDSIFNQQLAMDVQETARGRAATFNFILVSR